MTLIRDQGSCGSCVAFGTTATVEAQVRVQNGNPNYPIDLSEAHLFFCHARERGANCSTGWWPKEAFDAYKSKGVSDEAEAKAGSVVMVCLEENPTTGYRWKVETAGGMDLISDSFEKGGDAIGASGTRVFQFRTPESGVHRISIRNLRDWEGENSIIDQLYVTIDVK